MILRRLTDAFRKQDWFTVLIETLMVVLGVFLGLQVNNWNEARLEQEQEAAILAQLADEFSDIKIALERQIGVREGYIADLRSLIAGLEESGPEPDDLAIRRALVAARSTGRRPAQSSAYLQLTANGELARLSNEDLKQALIRYHARLDRDAFMFPELMRVVVQETSSNPYVDFDPSAPGTFGAVIDNPNETANLRAGIIRSYDFDGLREFEQHYETLYIMHLNLVDTDKAQLESANEILMLLSVEDRP